MRIVWSSPQVIFSTAAILLSIIGMTMSLWEIFALRTALAFGAPLVSFFVIDRVLPPWSDIPRYYLIAYVAALLVVFGIFALYAAPVFSIAAFIIALLVPFLESV